MPVGVLREDGRRLLYRAEGAEFIVSRPSDVPVFVEHGAADVGVVGKDVLDEQRPNVVELRDLGTGACRMILAAPRAKVDEVRRSIDHAEVVRVATKFPNIARRYFEGMGRQAEIIALHGSIELAPLVGLADAAVDPTATRTTPPRPRARTSRGATSRGWAGRPRSSPSTAPSSSPRSSASRTRSST